MKNVLKAALAFIVIGNGAQAFDEYAVYDDLYDVGGEARYFTAGVVRALHGGAKHDCGKDWSVGQINASYLNRLKGDDNQADKVALIAGYTMMVETGTYMLNSQRDCAALEASAAIGGSHCKGL